MSAPIVDALELARAALMAPPGESYGQPERAMLKACACALVAFAEDTRAIRRSVEELLSCSLRDTNRELAEVRETLMRLQVWLYTLPFGAR